MSNERTSFDVRSERLKLMAAKGTLASPVEDSKKDISISDWMQDLKALKSRREEEDLNRSRQLEEDILRERKARQERRAGRDRSTSPIKLEPQRAGLASPSTEIGFAQAKKSLTFPLSPDPGKSPKLINVPSLHSSQDTSEPEDSVSKTGRASRGPSDSISSTGSLRRKSLDNEQVSGASPTNLADVKRPMRVGGVSTPYRAAKSSPQQDLQPKPPRETETVPRSTASSQFLKHSIGPGRFNASSNAAVKSSDPPNTSQARKITLPNRLQGQSLSEKSNRLDLASILTGKRSNTAASEPSSESKKDLDPPQKLEHTTRDRARRPKGKKAPEIVQPSSNSTPAKIELPKLDTPVAPESTRIRPNSPDTVKPIAALPKLPERQDNLRTESLPAFKPLSRTDTRSSSPFNRTRGDIPRSQSRSSVSSMKSIASVIQDRAGAASPITESSPRTALCAWSVSLRGTFALKSGSNVLYDDEVIFIPPRKSEPWIRWRGEAAEDLGQSFITKQRIDAGLYDVFAGLEDSAFLERQGGSIVSCKGFRNETSDVHDGLFAIRSYENGFAVDEVPLTSASLCSGFSFLVITSKAFLWSGSGSLPSETAFATTFARNKFPNASLKCIQEGKEPAEFWTTLGDKLKYASSSYWKLKPDVVSYGCNLYTVDSDLEVRKHDVWCYNTLSSTPHKIHIIDAFFEMYIYISHSTNSHRKEMTAAFEWCKKFSRSLGSKRPFVPMLLVLCPGSRLPRDLKAAFRQVPAQNRSPLRVLELEVAESLLRKKQYSADELRTGIALGYDADQLNSVVNTADFESIMGLSQSEFQALSATKQTELCRSVSTGFQS